MAATHIGTVTGSTSATITTHQAGDLIIATVFRDGSTTAPTIPAGWTLWASAAGTTCWGGVYWRKATASGTASGTWTGATEVAFSVWRPSTGNIVYIGAGVTGVGTAASVTYPAMTLQDTGGQSTGFRFAGHRSINTTLETAPTGYTQRATLLDATAEIAVFSSTAAITAQTSTAVAVGGTASGWFAFTGEIKDMVPITGTLDYTLGDFGFTSAADIADTALTTPFKWLAPPANGTLSAYYGVADTKITGTNDVATFPTTMFPAGSKTYFELDLISLDMFAEGASGDLYWDLYGSSSGDDFYFYVSRDTGTPPVVAFSFGSTITLAETVSYGSTLTVAIDRVLERGWVRVGNGPWYGLSSDVNPDPATGSGGFSTLGRVFDYLSIESGQTSTLGLRVGSSGYAPPAGFTYLDGTGYVAPSVPPKSIFDHTTKTDDGSNFFDDGTNRVFGLKFWTKAPTVITHVSFWKNASDTATSRQVRIYDGTTIVASGTSSGEPTGAGAVGWRDIALSTPLAVSNTGPSKTYTAVVHFPDAKYKEYNNRFDNGYNSADGVIHIPSATEDAANGGNGQNMVLGQGAIALPTEGYMNSDWFIDIKYTAVPTAYGFNHATKTYGASNDDGTDITLGVRFAVPKSITLTHVSFWKTADDPFNARRVAIFDSAGTQLATGVSSGEPSGVAGWIDVALDTSLALTGEGTKSTYNTYYTAAVVQRKYVAITQGFADGSYSADGSVYFGAATDANVFNNGRYVYSAGGAFYIQDPTSNYANTDYGVDIRYTPVSVVTGSLTKVWTGSAWKTGVVKVWNGTAWVAKPAKARKDASTWY